MFFDDTISLPQLFHTLKQELRRPLDDKGHPFRFLTLSTSAQGVPEARWVVLRDVDEQLNFYIFSDFRTRKTEDLKQNPNATLLFYDDNQKLQIRLKGQVKPHHQNEVTNRYWKTVTGKAKRAYGSSIAPGSPVSRPEEAHQWPDEIGDDYFCVLQFSTMSIDALQLHILSHYRALFSLKQGDLAHSEWIAP
jgi:pyridoxine/pyridoxamine 5'-phosphate oxidase